MTNIIARHGDMTIFKVSKDQVKGMQTAETKKLTLGLGEVTGHSHEVLALDNSTIIEHHNVSGYDSAEIKDLTARENIFFEIKGTAVIMHEEHGPITLEEGVYLRTVQRQYNPFTKALEKVRD
jgi:hypothetical protein